MAQETTPAVIKERDVSYQWHNITTDEFKRMLFLGQTQEIELGQVKFELRRTHSGLHPAYFIKESGFPIIRLPEKRRVGRYLPMRIEDGTECEIGDLAVKFEIQNGQIAVGYKTSASAESVKLAPAYQKGQTAATSGHEAAEQADQALNAADQLKQRLHHRLTGPS